MSVKAALFAVSLTISRKQLSQLLKNNNNSMRNDDEAI